MKIDVGELREWLGQLQWGEGLTSPEMLAQAHARSHHPPPGVGHVIEQLPRDFRFRNPGEVTSFVEHLLRSGVLPGNADLSPVQPPVGYTDSPTGRVFHSGEVHHGVGSGAGSGYTGSDAQTGDSQSGVDYTAEEG
jgi:hypothetical protein